MNSWDIIVPWLPAMLLLISLSAFFSGSEAAFFSLKASDRNRLSPDRRLDRCILRLLDDPERLLSAVLFWNLVINMAYFGIASIISTRLQSADSTSVGFAFTLVSLLAIIFLSEMLPKSIAVKNAGTFAGVVAHPLDYSVAVARPILPALRFANLIARRILWPGFTPEKQLEIDDIVHAIEMTSSDQAFADRERHLLQNLVGLADTRVSEVMRPRSRYQTNQLPVSIDQMQEALSDGGYLFLGDEDGNTIDAVIPLRWLRPSQMDDLESAKVSPLIVPWATNASVVFDRLRRSGIAAAVVVNEYGETIGVVTLDDILDAILALAPQEDSPVGKSAVETLEVDGATSVRELSKKLGAQDPKLSNVTVAGLIQSLNRRIPRAGDTCIWEGYELKVIDELEKGELSIRVAPIEDAEENG